MFRDKGICGMLRDNEAPCHLVQSLQPGVSVHACAGTLSMKTKELGTQPHACQSWVPLGRLL